MKTRLLALGVLALAVCLASGSALGQEELTTKVYQVKWRDSVNLAALLRPFLQGEGQMAPNRAFNTLTVTTAHQQHVLIEELLEQYDVAARTVQFQFYILRARRSGSGIKNGLPEEIREVVKQVGMLTRYTQFELMDSPLIRASEGSESRVSGRTEYLYTLNLGEPHIADAKSGRAQIRVDRFSIQFLVPTGAVDPQGNTVVEQVGVGTAFSIADQETIVLGASQISQRPSDDAVITVVTAAIL